MRNLSEMVFIGEIAFQTEIALVSAKRLDADKMDVDEIVLWSAIQSILISAANISKLLWPSRKKYKLRGERLRELLRIEKNNVLSDRTFRNHFEHYDERVEEWFENKSSSVYDDLAINPSLYRSDITLATIHRGYNTYNQTVIFRGELFDLKKVLQALQEIKSECKKYTIV